MYKTMRTCIVALLGLALLAGCSPGTGQSSQPESEPTSICSECSEHEHESEPVSEPEATPDPVPTEEPQPTEEPDDPATPEPTAAPSPEPDCEHEYTTKTVQMNCTTDGYVLHTCGKCGYSFKTDVVKSKGHSFGEWAVTKSATCTAAGSRNHTCSACGKTVTESIPKLSHAYEFVKSVSSGTCAEGSSYELYKCKTCGTEEKRNQSSTGHKWELTGVAYNYCLVRYEGYTCSVCHEKKTEIIETGEYCSDHRSQWKKTKVVPPTCTTQGYTEYVCICGATFKKDYVNAVGGNHSFSSWKVIQEASATEGRDKIEERTCSKCGYKEYRETSIDGVSVNRKQYAGELSKGFYYEAVYGLRDYRTNVTTDMEMAAERKDATHIIVYWHDENGKKYTRTVCQWYNGVDDDGLHDPGAGVELRDSGVTVCYSYNP